MTPHSSADPAPKAPSLRRLAGCKVNLGLAITGRRSDGYHELDSFFYPLADPHDELTITLRPEAGLRVETDSPDLDPTHNTLVTAYTHVRERIPHLPGFSVHLKKGIPVGAGLGGGSSDAAAFLNALDHFGLRLPPEEKRRIAAEIGADVPFFLDPVPCRVRGIGDLLTPATLDCFPCLLLLVCPRLQVSTPWAYAEYDRRNLAAMAPATNTLTSTSFARNVQLSHVQEAQSVPWSFHNALEDAVFPCYPQLNALKNRLYDLGGQVCGMSGSGASLYALFPSVEEQRCQAARESLASSGYAVVVTRLS